MRSRQLFKLAPIALLSCIGAASAQQTSEPSTNSVRLYGVLDAALGSRQLSGQTSKRELFNGGLMTSYWGIGGSEDLGDGWAAKFDLQSFLRVDSGEMGRSNADPFWARNALLGLSSPYGTLTMGRLNTPTFLLGVRTNPLGSSTSFGPFMMHLYVPTAVQSMTTSFSATDAIWNNSISFQSKAWSGFSFQMMGAPDEGSTANGRRTAVAVNYNNGPLTSGLVYERASKMSLGWNGPPPFSAAKPLFTADDSKSVFGAMAYQLPGVKLFAQGSSAKLHSANTADEMTLTYTLAGVTVPVGAGNILIAWGHTKKHQSLLATDVKRDTATLAYDYRLSKRTDVYAALMHDKVNTLDKGKTFAVGLKHSF
jgi:predicted porin